jgi:hypothetical protein
MAGTSQDEPGHDEKESLQSQYWMHFQLGPGDPRLRNVSKDDEADTTTARRCPVDRLSASRPAMPPQ